MSVTVSLTTEESTAVVQVTTPPALPVAVNLVTAPAPVTVAVTMPPTPAISVNATVQAPPVAVAFQEARDAYQLAVAEGFAGTRAQWLESLRGTPGDPGPAGDNAQTNVLTLAAYLALSPAQQINGTWYAIPRTS